MKKESMRKYSLLGLVLIGASAVTAAVLPKNGSNKAQLAKLQVSAGEMGIAQLTCTLTEASFADDCQYTATQAGGDEDHWGSGSRTTVAGVSSSISDAFGQKVTTISDVNNVNSSQSPN